MRAAYLIYASFVQVSDTSKDLLNLVIRQLCKVCQRFHKLALVTNVIQHSLSDMGQRQKRRLVVPACLFDALQHGHDVETCFQVARVGCDINHGLRETDSRVQHGNLVGNVVRAGQVEATDVGLHKHVGLDVGTDEIGRALDIVGNELFDLLVQQVLLATRGKFLVLWDITQHI